MIIVHIVPTTQNVETMKELDEEKASIFVSVLSAKPLSGFGKVQALRDHSKLELEGIIGDITLEKMRFLFYISYPFEKTSSLYRKESS